MKTLLRYSALPASLLSLLLSTTALAVSDWTDYATVAELIPGTQFRYLVKLEVAENPSGCKNKVTFYQDYSATGSDHMFRVLLEAVSSGKRVRVYVTGKCELSGYSEISSVAIVP
jgi:hypothetical protein